MLNVDKYNVSIEDLKIKNALDNVDFKTTLTDEKRYVIIHDDLVK